MIGLNIFGTFHVLHQRTKNPAASPRINAPKNPVLTSPAPIGLFATYPKINPGTNPGLPANE